MIVVSCCSATYPRQAGMEEIWPGPAMKLVGPLAARSPGLRLALALEIERHCGANEILQGRLIDLVAFVDGDFDLGQEWASPLTAPPH